MTKPWQNHYCPFCLSPVDPESGDHWHYCEYERELPSGKLAEQQPLTELQMLKSKLKKATKERWRMNKECRILRARINKINNT